MIQGEYSQPDFHRSAGFSDVRTKENQVEEMYSRRITGRHITYVYNDSQETVSRQRIKRRTKAEGPGSACRL